MAQLGQVLSKGTLNRNVKKEREALKANSDRVIPYYFLYPNCQFPIALGGGQKTASLLQVRLGTERETPVR